MVDKHLMDQMENILSRLTIPVAIMDKDPETWSATEQLPLEQILPASPISSAVWIADFLHHISGICTNLTFKRSISS